MKLPSKIVDISQPLDNETVVDPDFMRPSIRYVTGKENAALMCELFPSLREDQMPPYHYNSKDSKGNRSLREDQMAARAGPSNSSSSRPTTAPIWRSCATWRSCRPSASRSPASPAR